MRISNVKKLSPEQQASVLSAPHVVWGLADKGEVARAVTLVERLSTEQQDSVLSAPHVVWGLAYSGEAARAIALIEKLSAEQQTSVLSAPDAVWSLAYKGEAARAVALVEKLLHRPNEHQRARRRRAWLWYFRIGDSGRTPDRTQRGFTLVEMGIVLVIIGLIIGGTLLGKSLIYQAQIRGTITAIQKYRQAYNAFVTKYSCVPGDCVNAQAFGLSYSSACGGTATMVNSNSNGNGDGFIYSYQDGSTLPSGEAAWCESWNAFNHLYNAGFIANVQAHYGEQIKNIPMYDGFMFLTSLRPANPPAGYILPDKDTNYLYIGSWPFNGESFENANPIFMPADAYAIDAKIDDGLPMSGAVRASWVDYSCGNRVFQSTHYGPCFNAPTTRSAQAGATCVDDMSSPPVYWTSSDYYSQAQNQLNGLCSIHVPVN